nr:hypothetical protein [Tanacetum cinerariifolium]
NLGVAARDFALYHGVRVYDVVEYYCHLLADVGGGHALPLLRAVGVHAHAHFGAASLVVVHAGIAHYLTGEGCASGTSAVLFNSNQADERLTVQVFGLGVVEQHHVGRQSSTSFIRAQQPVHAGRIAQVYT